MTIRQQKLFTSMARPASQSMLVDVLADAWKRFGKHTREGVLR